MISRTLTFPLLAVAAGMTLSSPMSSSLVEPNYMASIVSYDTLSENSSLTGFYNYRNARNDKENALRFFGEQSVLNNEERDFYKKVIKQKATPVGTNLFNMFG